MQIREADIADLVPDPHNARTHDAKNLKAIAASLNRWGQVEPLVVQRGTNIVIGGNGRLEVLKAKGAKKVEIVEVDVTDDEARALGIALNRTGELAGWDGDRLRAMVDSVRLDGFDFDDLALSQKDLEALAPVFVPSDDPQTRLDEKAMTTCPKCGHEFHR